MTITNAQRSEIIEVVVVLFNAAPGATYLAELSPYAGNPAALVNDLVSIPAFTSLYPIFQTNEEFAEQFVANLLGASVGANQIAEGENFVASLLNGGASRADAVLAALAALRGVDAADPNWGAARTLLENKIAVAEFYSVNQNGTATDVATLQAVVASVTADSDVSSPEAIEAIIPAAPGTPEPGQILTLTTAAAQINEGAANTFTVTASAPVDVDTDVTFQLALGTAQLDDFPAGAFNPVTVVIPAGGTTATYEVTTVGADGTELAETYSVSASVGGVSVGTVEVTILDGSAEGTAQTITLTTNADTPTAVSPAVSTLGTAGVDIYSGVFDAAGGGTTISNTDILDGAGGTDVLNIRVASVSDGGSTIAPVSTNVETFFITNQVGSGAAFTLNFLNIQGETQVWDKASLSGALTRALNVDPTATAGMESTLGNFEVNLSGDRSGSTDAFLLALNGAGSATQTASFSTITTSGANDATFEIANISSTTTMSNVSLGKGAMTLKTVNISGDAALKLGEHQNFAGLSTLDASSMTAGGVNVDARGSTESGFVFKGTSEVDRVVLNNSTINTASSLDGGGGKDTLASQNFGGLQASAVNNATSFEVLEGVGGVENFNASNFTGINEFLFTGTTGNNDRAFFSGVENSDRIALSTDVTAGSYAIRVEGNNAGTSAHIELRAVNETNGETVIRGNNTQSSSEFGIELRSNISTLVIDSTGTSAKANLIEVANGSDSSNYAIGNESTSVFKITGSQDLTILAKEGVDVSDGEKLAGFSQAASIDASDFSGVLRIAGSNENDVIVGGSGNDIIYGMGGSDVLTGNGGADQFRLAEFYNRTDTIMDFENGIDKVGLNEFNFGNTTATQAGTTLSAADYVDNLSSIAAISGAEDKKIVELQSSLSGAQIAAQTSTAAAEAYVLVHNTTSGKAELWYDSNWNDTGDRSHILTFDNVIDLIGVTSFSNTDFVEYSF